MASKHVINGVLIATSPSAIEAFDSNSPFGCQRKWYFEHVLGLGKVDTEAQRLGTLVHALMEARVQGLSVTPGVLGDDKPSVRAKNLAMAMFPVADEVRREGNIVAERWLTPTLDIHGVQVRGKVDVTVLDGVAVKKILDWKTTKNLKYMKSPAQLREDTQMLVYAEHARLHMPTKQAIELEEVFVQKEGPTLVERVITKIDRPTLAKNFERVKTKVLEMKDAARVADVSKLEPDRSKCRFCSFAEQCPKENKLMASLLDKMNSLKSKANDAPAVIPPDAPKSNPALAAKPVAGLPVQEKPPEKFEAIPPPKERKLLIVDEKPKAVAASEAAAPEAEPVAGVVPTEERRGRGRPPGSKNKPQEPQAEAPKSTTAAAFESCTVNYGMTINLGDFNSARVDVSFTVRGTDPDLIYKTARDQAVARVTELASEAIESKKAT